MDRLRTAIALCLLVAGTTAHGQQVSADLARERAIEWLTQKSDDSRRTAPGSRTALTLVHTGLTAEGETAYYIFKKENDDLPDKEQDGGFIIVSGDESLTPILGHCDHGDFNWETAPDNFKWWMSTIHPLSHSAGESMNTPQPSAARARRASLRKAEIPKLLTCQWSQEEPYYNAIPTISGSHPVTGCVATAMAQAMYYYKHPTQGTGSYSYTSSKRTYSADFGSTTYDWDNMIDDYSGDYTDEQAAAVATLMYHCGVSVDMSYSTTSSGAGTFVIPKALVNYFGYDNSIDNEWRDYYTDSDWEDLVYSELAEERPVLYCGVATDGGHQFVCDGYSETQDLYHFNWGWAGYCDGYYALTGTGALAPNGSGTGGAGDDAAYTSMQIICTHFMPDQGGAERPHYVVYGSTCSLSKSQVSISGSSASVTLNVQSLNIGSHNTTVAVGVKAVEVLTGETHYYSISQESKSIGYYGTASLAFDAKALTYNGDYEIYPVCRLTTSSDDADWRVMDLPVDMSVPVLTVTGGTTRDPLDVTFEISDTEVEVGRQLQITHDATYDGTVTYTTSDASVAAVDADGTVTGIGLGTCTLTANGAATSTYKATVTSFEITVKETVKETVPLQLATSTLSVGETTTVTVPSDYTGTLDIELSDASVAQVQSDGTIVALAAGTTEVRVTAPESPLYRKTYTSLQLKVTETVTEASGLMLTAVPTFSNDNYPTTTDFSLSMSLKNNSSSAITPVLGFYVDGIGSFYLSFSSSLAAGASTTVSVSWTSLLSYFTVGTTYTVHYYSDKNCTTAFNVPTSTFTLCEELTYDYVMTAAGVGTLIVPFSCNVPSGLKAWECRSCSEGGELILNRASQFKRNVPYILTGEAGTYSLTGAGVISELSAGAGLLVGVLEEGAETLELGDYVLQNHGGVVGFYRVGQSQVGREMPAYRAFLRVPDSMLEVLTMPDLSGDDESLGIEEVQQPSALPHDADDTVWTLDGKRATKEQHGLCIEHGHVTLRK